MKQSRLMSLVESVANVIVGYGVAVVTQILIFPIFGLHTTLAQNLKMGAVFTVVSHRAFLRPAAAVRGDPDAERPACEVAADRTCRPVWQSGPLDVERRALLSAASRPDAGSAGAREPRPVGAQIVAVMKLVLPGASGRARTHRSAREV